MRKDDKTMRCRICGTENEEGRVICSKCLKPLEIEKKKNNKKNCLIAAIAALLVAAVVFVVVFVILPKQNEKPSEPEEQAKQEEPAQAAGEAERGSKAEEEIPDTEYFVEDAEAYYAEHGKIISTTDAGKSKDVRTEAETISAMDSRGLAQYPVTSEYSISGKYSEAADVSADSDTKHPIYTTYYVAENGDLWTISEVNGQVCAYPVSYIMNSGLETPVIISETETIISYDSETNRFFEMIPDPATLIVKTVERIDAETLEKLSKEGVGSI